MKEPIPDCLPANGLVENRDGLVSILHAEILASVEQLYPKLSLTDALGALEAVKLEVYGRFMRYRIESNEDDD